MDVDVYVLVVIGHDAVCHDDGVAIAQFAVLCEQVFLGFLVFGIDELPASEPSGHGVLLEYLLQYAGLDDVAFYLCRAQVFVAGDVDAVDFHLVLLLDVDVHYHLVGCSGIVSLQDVYHGVLVAFFGEVPLCEDFSTVYHVGRQLAVLYQAHLFLEVVALVFSYAIEVDLRDARTLGELDVEVGRVSHEAVHADGHVAEESVAPIAFDGFGYFFAWDLYLLSLAQSAQPYQQVVVVVAHTVDGNISDVVLAWCSAVVDFGCYFTLHHLREHGREQSEKTYYNKVYPFHFDVECSVLIIPS